ncbi:hypothetical protein [Burkholderia sp.]|nr:hypothetical protein [Burkholderia sp.]MCA3931539.1 hypothetical protein [Burkholderia sp.]
MTALPKVAHVQWRLLADHPHNYLLDVAAPRGAAEHEVPGFFNQANGS